MTRHTSTLVRAACAALALALAAAAAAAQTRATATKTGAPQTPDAFVTAFYRGHYARHQRWDLTEKRERAKFTPELLALLDADDKKQAASPDEVVGLDFDPITASQEESTRFKVTGTTREGDDAIVSVVVYVGTEHQTVRVKLAPFGASWRIANFLYQEGDLISDLKEPN